MDNLWQSVLLLIGASGVAACLIGIFYLLRAKPHKTDDVDWVTLFTIDPLVWSECFLYLYAAEGQALVQRGWKWFRCGLILIVAALLIQVMFAIA
ncbi:MAG: hypothetical protein ACI82H_000014 [Alphaproteobacteria bacterium]|jgi:hypothetical protein